MKILLRKVKNTKNYQEFTEVWVKMVVRVVKIVKNETTAFVDCLLTIISIFFGCS